MWLWREPRTSDDYGNRRWGPYSLRSSTTAVMLFCSLSVRLFHHSPNSLVYSTSWIIGLCIHLRNIVNGVVVHTVLSGTSVTDPADRMQPAWRPLLAGNLRIVDEKVPADALRDPRSGGLDGIPGQVSAARGRLHLRVTKQFPDHCETLTERQCAGCKGCAEVVNMPARYWPVRSTP